MWILDHESSVAASLCTARCMHDRSVTIPSELSLGSSLYRYYRYYTAVDRVDVQYLSSVYSLETF